MNIDKLLDYLNLDKKEFYFQFQSHPNFPSVLAFSDTLKFLGISNEAYEIEQEDTWNQLPKEFITVFNQKLSLVKSNKNNLTVYSDIIKSYSKEDFRGMYMRNNRGFPISKNLKSQIRFPHLKN